MSQEIIKNSESKMEKRLEGLQKELAGIRTGRANPTILDRIQFDYYGSMTPINQVTAISVVEGRQLLVKPYDPSVIRNIEKAISDSDLGLNPQNDGAVLRINIPPLTEERRKDLVKQVSKIAEEAKVSIRNVRRDANDDVKKANLPEDEAKGLQNDIQKVTDNMIKKVDEMCKIKQDDIMTV